MKPIRIVLSPTRSRPLNVFLGLVLLLVSLLLLLALATYHASDPSLNTATDTAAPHAVRNWVGLFGAWLSDLLLQSLGVTAFLLPLWLGGIGWTWMHSRPGGSAWLRWAGTLLALAFLPAVFGLMPWHWRWLHVLPVEGVVGRLDRRPAGDLPQHPGRMACGRCAGRRRSLFCLRRQLLGVKEHAGPLASRFAPARPWRNWREERAEREKRPSASAGTGARFRSAKSRAGAVFAFSAPPAA